MISSTALGMTPLSSFLKHINNQIVHQTQSKIVNIDSAQPLQSSLARYFPATTLTLRAYFNPRRINIDLRTKPLYLALIVALIFNVTAKAPLLSIILFILITICTQADTRLGSTINAISIPARYNFLLSHEEKKHSQDQVNLNRIKNRIINLPSTFNTDYILRLNILRALCAEQQRQQNATDAYDCCVITGLGLIKLIESKRSDITTVEYFLRQQGNKALFHNFLVINRNQNSNWQDMSSWGEQCYILDPWSNICDRASQVSQWLAQYPLLDPATITPECDKPILITTKSMPNYIALIESGKQQFGNLPNQLQLY